MTPAPATPASAAPVRRLVADMDGPVSLPRSNGELVFEEPWESRAFGTAVALAGADAVDWESFRQELIAEIGRWEREHGESAAEDWSYYERWLAALERLLLSRGLLAETEIELRAREIADREAHEHDHHDHEEDQ